MNCPYVEVLKQQAAVYTDCNSCPISKCKFPEIKEKFKKENKQNEQQST